MKPVERQEYGKFVSRTMPGLTKAVSRFVSSESVAKDLVFNLAEIYPEVLEFAAIMERAALEQLAKNDLARLNYFLNTHWPYHAAEILRIIDEEGIQ